MSLLELFHIVRAFKDPFKGRLFPHDSVRHAAIGYLLGNGEAPTAAGSVKDWKVEGGRGSGVSVSVLLPLSSADISTGEHSG